MSCRFVYFEHCVIGTQIHKFLRFDYQPSRHGDWGKANESTPKSAAILKWSRGSGDSAKGDDISAQESDEMVSLGLDRAESIYGRQWFKAGEDYGKLNYDYMSDFLGEDLRCNDGMYTLIIHKPLWSPTIEVVETCTSFFRGIIFFGTKCYVWSGKFPLELRLICLVCSNALQSDLTLFRWSLCRVVSPNLWSALQLKLAACGVLQSAIYLTTVILAHMIQTTYASGIPVRSNQFKPFPEQLSCNSIHPNRMKYPFSRISSPTPYSMSITSF